jgi:hypothetical protein
VSTPAELDEQEAAERERAELAEREAEQERELGSGDVDELEAAAAGAEPEHAGDAGEPEQGSNGAAAAAGDGPQASSFAEAEAINKQLDRVESYLTRKYEEIFGADAADLQDCPLCAWSRTWGRIVPRVPPEEVREAVKVAIGMGTLSELREVPQFQTCQVCGGYCNVLTGAKAGNQLYRRCPNCKGAGYTSSLPDDPSPAAAGTPSIAEPLAEGLPPQTPDFDQFGTPRGHPDYGKLVQYREVPVSAWADNLPK